MARLLRYTFLSKRSRFQPHLPTTVMFFFSLFLFINNQLLKHVCLCCSVCYITHHVTLSVYLLTPFHCSYLQGFNPETMGTSQTLTFSTKGFSSLLSHYPLFEPHYFPCEYLQDFH